MYVLQFKKIEVSITSDSKDTMNRTIKFFLKRMTRWGIIPRGVMFWRIFQWLTGVWYPSESIRNLPKHDSPGYLSYFTESVSPGYDTPGSHGTKLFIISPLGRIPLRVSLPVVWYPVESVFLGYATPGSRSKLRGVNSHFSKYLHRQIKGEWHKITGFLFYY